MRLTDCHLAALIALAASAPSTAFAVRCGDTLTADTRLQADLVCTGHAHALQIATPGVTLWLDGYRIISDGTAVSIDAVDGVRIAGPGRLSGSGCGPSAFASGLVAVHANATVVEGITVAGFGIGIQLAGTSNATVYANEISDTNVGVLVVSTMPYGRPSRQNSVESNHIVGTQACPSYGLMLDGLSTEGNHVASNRIDDALIGILLRDADNNAIVDNNVASSVASGGSGVYLGGSNHNKVAHNQIVGYTTGVRLDPNGRQSLFFGAPPRSAHNAILNNAIKAIDVAVYLGDALRPGTAATQHNLVSGNALTTGPAGVGIHLQPDTFNNDATGNFYHRIRRWVVDLGIANRWP